MALAGWLRKVAASAQGLRESLAAENRFPDGFPAKDIDALAITLEQTTHMTVDGALGALTYAGDKLDYIRQRWIAVSSEDELPEMPWSGRIDTPLARLSADVRTARAWYADPLKERAEESPIAEGQTAVSQSGDLATLSSQVGEISDGAGAIAEQLAQGQISGSVGADNLVRGVRDVEILTQQERLELLSAEPRLRLIDRLNRAILVSANLTIYFSRGVQIGTDFLGIAAEAVHKIGVRSWIDAIHEAAQSVEKTVEEYRTKWTTTHSAPSLRTISEKPLDKFESLAVFRDRLLDGTVGPEMVVVPEGSYLRGSLEEDDTAYTDEKPQRRVTLNYRFALSRSPLTFGRYREFAIATGRGIPDGGVSGSADQPVVNVTWHEASDYCEWLSKALGVQYRLPSEAEWEYACRAGTTTRYWWGDEWDFNKANGHRAVGHPTRAGEYPANPWGLFDMVGNVWEWCLDHYEPRYETASTNGTAFISYNAGPNAPRVLRGGSWRERPEDLRCSIRSKGLGMRRNRDTGIRLCRTIWRGQPS